MYRKLSLLVCLVVVLGMVSSVSALEVMKCDIGFGGDLVQPGWTWIEGQWNENVTGTGIDVFVCSGEDGGPHGLCCGMDMRAEGGSGPLALVEADMFFADGSDNSPCQDLILWFKGLPAGGYRVRSYHNRAWREPCLITDVVVTGATDVTAPDEILQSHDIMENPAEILFTANGVNDVNIRYVGEEGVKDAPWFNGFTLDFITGTWPKPSEPNPGYEITNICPNDLTLIWTPVPGTTAHDIYLGTGLNDVNVSMATPAVTDHDSNTWTVPYQLELQTIYYWRVVDKDGGTHEGPIWQFTTNNGQAYGPTPEDGLKGIAYSNVTLSWTPACVAESHKIYFSSDYNSVDNNTAYIDELDAADTNYTPSSLEPFIWYYWRVDEVIDRNEVRGNIWSFRTGLGGCLVHFRFQGTPGQELDVNVTDYTGNVTFTQVAQDVNGLLTYDEDNAFGVPGVTSGRFSPRMGLRRDDPAPADGFDILRLDVYQWTLEFWVRPETIDHDTALIQKWGGEGQDQYTFMFDEPEYGYTQIDWRLAELGDGVKSNSESVILGEWNHVVAIFDTTSEYPLKMYINGIQQYSLGYPGGMLPGNNTAPVQLGYGQNGWLDGQMDEVRIFDIALGPEDFLYTPGPEWASNPSPYHGELGIDANNPNFALSWTPGIYAQTQDVYFSSSFDDVNERSGGALIADDLPENVNEVNGIDLEFGKTYYWRVDTANDSCSPNFWGGVIWKFTTQYLLLDPNLRAWYKLDETSGITVPDASGYNHHAEAEKYQVILPDWEPDGQFDGCMRFDDDTHIDVPSGVLSTIDKEISISVWLNGDSDQRGGDNWIMQAGDDPYYIEVIAPDSSSDLYWRAGGSEANDILVWTDATPRSWEGDWHHFVFIKNENTGLMGIYLDGELKKSKGGTFTSLTNLVEQPIRAAAALGNMGDYVGKMDDLRIYSKALSEDEVLQLMRGGNLAIAWAPSPYDGQPDAPVNPDLGWRPGDYVADTNGHDVYFGTNRQEVEDANRTNHPNVQYANTSDTTYDVGILDLGGRYYWRVDEVNGPNTWTGPVWRFSVAQYITIDDMEDYNPGFSGYPITNSTGDYGWDCGYTNDTSSFLDLLHPTSSYGILSHGGDRAMYYYYENSFDNGAGYYSEISNHFELDPNDWTYGGVKMLTLWFHGDPENANTGVEQMYVGLEDTSGIGSYSEVRYGNGEGEDVNDIVIAEWQEWNIPLSSFADVNLKSMDKLYIGFGERYYWLAGGSGGVGFDDIRLYQPTCVPSKAKPADDLNYDCIVDFGDVEIMADEWLKSDVNLGVVIKPPDANLLGWWELDYGAGPDVWDSSDYWNTGTIETIDSNVWWVAGRGDVNYALDFDGGRILVPDAAELRPTDQVSASAWILYSTGQDSARVVVKGADNRETYELEVSGTDELVFQVREDGNEADLVRHAVSTSDLSLDEWLHIAGTYDGNDLKCYINGELKESAAIGAIALSQDTNDLAIGNRSDATNRPFAGTIDDIRVYDYGLSAAEVAYLATDGTGILAVQSIANIINEEELGERAVNLRDFAELADSWLEEKLYPQ